MPWREDSVMDQRRDCVLDVLAGNEAVSHIAHRYGVSRPTVYRWLQRFMGQGGSMQDKSRRPHHSPQRTLPEVEKAIGDLRERHEDWGPLKIHARLAREGQQGLPTSRTVGRILKRHGYTQPAQEHPEEPTPFERSAPNELWQLDFKKPYRLHTKTPPLKGIPLTIIDDHSRFNIALYALPNYQLKTVWPLLWEVLGAYGMPDAILTDNDNGLFRSHRHGVTTWTARLWRLGIEHLSGRPYHPQTQGKVERMHRTIQLEALRKSSFPSLAELQQGLDDFRWVYNHYRPHQAIDLQVPADRYHPSPRERPDLLPPVEYPEGSTLRKVTSAGYVSIRGARVHVGEGIAGEAVQLHEGDLALQIEYAQHIVRAVLWQELRSGEWV